MRQLKINQSVSSPKDNPISLSPNHEKIIAKKLEGIENPETKQLVKSNLQMVISIAERCKNKELHSDQLLDLGIEGLFKAIEKYENDIDKFHRFAGWWIRQGIMEGVKSGRKHK